METSSESNKPEKRPQARKPADMDPEERDFWDLDEEPDGPEEASAPSPGQSDPAGGDRPEVPEDGASEAPPQEASAEDQPPPPKAQKSGRQRSISPVELTALAVLAAVLVALGIWALVVFRSSVPSSARGTRVEFPVKGQRVEIVSLQTYWRKPEAGKDQGISRNARLLPAVVLKIGPSGEKSALRCFFEDDEGRFVGDPTTVGIENGTFTPEGGTEIEIYGTNGFDNEGDHAAYLAGEMDSWFFIVKEGPHPRAPGREFTEILRIPISKQRR